MVGFGVALPSQGSLFRSLQSQSRHIDRKERVFLAGYPPSEPLMLPEQTERPLSPTDSSPTTVVSRHLKVCLGGRLKAIMQSTRCLGRHLFTYKLKVKSSKQEAIRNFKLLTPSIELVTKWFLQSLVPAPRLGLRECQAPLCW